MTRGTDSVSLQVTPKGILDLSSLVNCTQIAFIPSHIITRYEAFMVRASIEIIVKQTVPGYKTYLTLSGGPSVQDLAGIID